jgi:hypothetical protein
MGRKPWVVLALVIAALAPLPAGRAAILTPLGTQDNQVLFQDRAGDAPASADIATVVVSNDNAGFISFQVVFTGNPAKDLTARTYLDTDMNTATGASDHFGADYQAVISDLSEGGSAFSLRRWNGKTFKEFFSQAPDVTLSGGVLTFAFASSDLGKPSDLRFTLSTQRRSAVTLDRAPNAGQTPWSFHIKTAPVRLSILGFKMTPKPQEGHKLVASMTVKPSTPIAGLASRLVGPVCVATVAGRSLSERSSSLNETEGSPRVAAVCVWRIPQGTSGKLFRASVKVSFRGKAKMRSASAKIIATAHAVLGQAQLPAIVLSDATLAKISDRLHEKFRFFSTAADAARSTLDPNDTGEDLKQLGRIAGYVRGRNAHGAFTEHPPNGLLTVGTSVTLWRGAAAARASIRRDAADRKRFAGTKLPGGQLVSSTCSQVKKLDATLCREHTRSARGIDFFGTSVIFSVNRLRGSAIVLRHDGANKDALALSLAAKLRTRAIAAVGRLN